MLLRGMRDKPNITKIALHSKNIARILRRSRVSNSAQDLALQCGALKSIGWQNMAFNAPHALAKEEARGPDPKLWIVPRFFTMSGRAASISCRFNKRQ